MEIFRRKWVKFLSNKVNTLRGSPQSLSLCKYVQISNYISNRLVLKYSPCKDHEKCISRYTFFMVTDSVNRGIFNPMPYQSISIMKITMNPIDTWSFSIVTNSCQKMSPAYRFAISTYRSPSEISQILGQEL